ncbi:hypothetical protein [Lysinibacillus sp. 3P01SB]|uniref:hypothetical protein n=1 Tax=Lysinibacillus sp. 3P01SB TaxID=3132284 RepID=UPI0039A55582
MLKNILENAELLQNIFDISIAVILLCSILSLRLFRKVKREKKLSPFDSMIYLLIRLAIFLWLASFLLMEYGTYLQKLTSLRWFS